jgi:hypothetical protein
VVANTLNEAFPGTLLMWAETEPGATARAGLWMPMTATNVAISVAMRWRRAQEVTVPPLDQELMKNAALTNPERSRFR